MSGEPTAYEIISKHCGKSIESVEEVGKHIKIKFYDGTHLVLLDTGCNTCGGHRVEGAEY